jgi:BirA family biotin operon repressor/biotin-[acetyl-CoA-carboxylase] ligase
LAKEQTAGKGHAGNSWESEKGKNLTFSLVLRPVFIEPSNQFLITQLVSVALTNFLKKRMPPEIVKIKWPNDIYIEDKKIAGILIQNTIRGNSLDYSVIGVGLNVNQETFRSDAPNPVSMIYYTGEHHHPEVLLDELYNEIIAVYASTASPQFVNLLQNFYLDNLYRFAELAAYKSGDKEFRGTIVGVGEYGRLQIKDEEGTVAEFNFKEVEFL